MKFYHLDQNILMGYQQLVLKLFQIDGVVLLQTTETSFFSVTCHIVHAHFLNKIHPC